MELQGKRINFLGDSITEGHGVAEKENIFVNRLKTALKLGEARNYGIGGTRIALQRVPSANERWDLNFIQRAKEMRPDADVVVVFGGTNDFGHGDAPFGTFEDRTADTFCGACHVLYRELLERFPAAQLVILTPLHRCGEAAHDGKPELRTYVEMIRRIAEYYAIPVLDLYAQSGIQPEVPIIKEWYCPDGLHPNDDGHRLIAEKLKGFLEML